MIKENIDINENIFFFGLLGLNFIAKLLILLRIKIIFRWKFFKSYRFKIIY